MTISTSITSGELAARRSIVNKLIPGFNHNNLRGTTSGIPSSPYPLNKSNQESAYKNKETRICLPISEGIRIRRISPSHMPLMPFSRPLIILSRPTQRLADITQERSTLCLTHLELFGLAAGTGIFKRSLGSPHRCNVVYRHLGYSIDFAFATVGWSKNS